MRLIGGDINFYFFSVIVNGSGSSAGAMSSLQFAYIISIYFKSHYSLTFLSVLREAT